MSTAAPIIEKASAGVRELFNAFTASEAKFFDEERFSEAELRRSLSDTLTDKKLDAMKRILAAVSVGRDASSLFSDVVKNVSSPSLELKKLIYIYLVQYAENNRELALLSINSFQKDLTDRSQLVRASALRAMASIKVLEVIQLVMVAVKNASQDGSPYVRRTAAQCMTKVCAVDPDQFFELRSLLLRLLGDEDVTVVSSAVMAFHHICVMRHPGATRDAPLDDETNNVMANSRIHAVREQLELLHPHFRRLCQEILLMDAWAQQCGIDMLLRYCRLFFGNPSSNKECDQVADEEAEQPSPLCEDFYAFLQTLKLLLNSSMSNGVTLMAAAALCYLAPVKDLIVIVQPLLRALRQAPPESAHMLMVAFMPIIEGMPDLVRPMIREFFVQSFDVPAVKTLKLKILGTLVDETNVQLLLRELQTYTAWQSQPTFVAQAVGSIAHVGLKVSSVGDYCLRVLVRMLNSKCDALACEAVVALRALLQQRQQKENSGLGSVLPYLANYLDNLTAPTARASVVWIIGQYQCEAPRLAPDVVRKLAKSFPTERQEVKQQTLALSLKVWAFHALNSCNRIPSKGRESAAAVAEGTSDIDKLSEISSEESATLLPRLEAIVDHIHNLAFYDAAWDVRDTARALQRIKEGAKTVVCDGATKPTEPLQEFGLAYCQHCIGNLVTDIQKSAQGTKDSSCGVDANASLETTWFLGSLAHMLGYPLDTYQPLPDWAEKDSEEAAAIRNLKVDSTTTFASKSISSSSMGYTQPRTLNPSKTNMPVVTSLDDLDKFYSDSGGTITRPGPALDGVSVAPIGTAVLGEDDESDDEVFEDDEEDDGNDWKYCRQVKEGTDNSALPAAVSTEQSILSPCEEAEKPLVEAVAEAPREPAASPSQQSADVYP